MTPDFAAEIATWRYPPPYDLNDMTGADPSFLASPESGFWALTGDGELLGYRSFGPDGRVPGYDYDESALDTGGGLRPDLTGRGLGAQAISAGLEFGQREFAPAAFRMTIAAFNVRAQRVVLRLGFTLTASFLAPTGVRYQILVRSAGRHPVGADDLGVGARGPGDAPVRDARLELSERGRVGQRVMVAVEDRDVHEADPVGQPERGVRDLARVLGVQLGEHLADQSLVLVRALGPGRVPDNLRHAHAAPS